MFPKVPRSALACRKILTSNLQGVKWVCESWATFQKTWFQIVQINGLDCPRQCGSAVQSAYVLNDSADTPYIWNRSFAYLARRFFSTIASTVRSMMYISMPITQAIVMYAHAVGNWPLTMFSLICLPTPITCSAKYSLTTAPIIQDGALTLKAVNT